MTLPRDHRSMIASVATCCTPFTVEAIPRVSPRETNNERVRPRIDRPSVRPSVPRASAGSHGYTRAARVRGKSRPGPTPFLFSRTRLSYISCSTPEFQLWLSLREPCSSRRPLAGSRSPQRDAWDHVSLSINDFYGLPSSLLGFSRFFFSCPTKTDLSSSSSSSSFPEEKERKSQEGGGRAFRAHLSDRSCTCRSRRHAEGATNYYDQLNNSRN